MPDIGFIAANGVDLGRIYDPGKGTLSLGIHDVSGVDIGSKFLKGSGGPKSGYQSFQGGSYKDLNELLCFGATQIMFGWFGGWGQPVYRPGGPGFTPPTPSPKGNNGWGYCGAIRDAVKNDWARCQPYFYPVPESISVRPWGGGSTQGFGCAWRVFASGQDPDTEITVNASKWGHNHYYVEKVSQWCTVVAMYSDDWDWRDGCGFDVDISIRVPGFPLATHHGAWRH